MRSAREPKASNVWSNGTVRVVAEVGDSVPGSTTTTFFRFQEVSISSGETMFWASDSNSDIGLYVERGGVIENVVLTGSTDVDGNTLDDIRFSNQGFDDNQFVFIGEFGTDDGVFIGTLSTTPTVPSLPLLSTVIAALALVAIGLLMRRRARAWSAG